MPKKKPMKGKPQVNKELEGFEISINEFGEIQSNFKIDKLNQFLNKHVEDKKLVDRDDLNTDEPLKDSDGDTRESGEK